MCHDPFLLIALQGASKMPEELDEEEQAEWEDPDPLWYTNRTARPRPQTRDANRAIQHYAPPHRAGAAA